MFHIAHETPAPLSLVEARRIVRDPAHAARFDPLTRQLAWRICNDARKGQGSTVLVLVAGFAVAIPQPKDAA